MMSGTIGPRIFVRNEMTKKISRTIPTASVLRATAPPRVTRSLFGFGHFACVLELSGFAASEPRQRERHHFHGKYFEDWQQFRVTGRDSQGLQPCVSADSVAPEPTTAQLACQPLIEHASRLVAIEHDGRHVVLEHFERAMPKRRAAHPL